MTKTQTRLKSGGFFTRNRAVCVILLCAAFLFYKYILQVYPGVITTDLMRDFNLTGAGLGNLAATFYYSYMVMQLFVGPLTDKLGVRRVSVVAILCAAIGLIVFSQSHSTLIAGFARAFMGLGVAFATVAYMKTAAVWFAPERYAFVGGLLATAAMAGAVFGEAPLSFLMSHWGWREVLFWVGLIGIGLAVLFSILMRSQPPRAPFAKQYEEPFSWPIIFALLKDKRNWLLTLYSGFAFSPLAILGGLWGNPFLQQAYGLNATSAGTFVSLGFIGLGIGSPILGLVSDRVGRLPVMFFGTLVSLLSIAAVLYLPELPHWLLGSFLFLFGFFLGSFMLAFAVGKDINSLAVTATVIAMINASDAFLDAFTEPAIGKFLDAYSHSNMIHGVHFFSAYDYRVALSILPFYLILALICLLLFKKFDKNRLGLLIRVADCQ